MNTGRLRPLLLVLPFLAACDSPTGLVPLTSPPTDLETAREHWEAHGLESYRFDTERLCFCSAEWIEPVRVRVRDGAVVAVVSRETWVPRARPSENGGVLRYTIEDLFDRIEEALESGRFLEVEYDRRGYPAILTIGTMANDGGTRYVVGNVRRLD